MLHMSPMSPMSSSHQKPVNNSGRWVPSRLAEEPAQGEPGLKVQMTMIMIRMVITMMMMVMIMVVMIMTKMTIIVVMMNTSSVLVMSGKVSFWSFPKESRTFAFSEAKSC